MALDGVSNRTSYLGTGLLNIRSQLDELQTQLSTGKVSNTYAGQGINRGFAIGLRAQLNDLASYKDTVTNVDTRINVANAALGRIGAIGSAVRASASAATNQLGNSGQTTSQTQAQASLAEMLQLLNVRAGDRYLFSGRATDTPSVADLNDILDGSGAKAGLKQIVAERKLADLGASGLGRLVVSAPTATSVGLAEDVAGSPFGLKLNAVTSSLTGATVAGPAGAPPAISIDLGVANPNAGDKIRFTFDLPDGTAETIELAASSATPAPAGTFALGATSDVTAANLQAALTAAVGKLAKGPLVAASALTASDNFFNASPPLRVGTAPFDAATTLVAGTTSNTVSWYTGENGSDPARGTAVARIDQTLTAQYGARANEQGIRWQLQNIAVFAAVSTSTSDPDASAQVGALNQRIAINLATQQGQQSIQDIVADFAGAQSAMKAATDRQTQTKSMVETMLAQIEGVNNDEVATKILALQTNLQASYQTTAMLYQTSLLKFI
jgi:flagellin-like hook-associated protein FlgL